MEQNTISYLSNYLCQSCCKIGKCKVTHVVNIQDNGIQISGLQAAVKYIIRKSGRTDLLGVTLEDRALVDQWLEYRVTVLDRITSKGDMLIALKELDQCLQDRTYLVGVYPTVADYVLYFGLHNILMKMTFQERQSVSNLSRWFNHIQSTEGLRQKLDTVIFQKNLIYSKYTH